MKQTNRFFFCSLLVSGMLLLLMISCKKDDTNKAETSNDITDIDGNIYHSVTIGTQVWMLENLKTTRYRNGDPILNVSDSAQWANSTASAYCEYNNNHNNFTVYGNLYNWYAVTDSRNIAPKGWHVPTGSEYIVLSQFIEQKAGKLKETGTVHWVYNQGTDNSSGFTALPGGFRNNDGSFRFLGHNAYFWTSASNAFAWQLAEIDMVMSNIDYPKNTGISVRCIKDL